LTEHEQGIRANKIQFGLQMLTVLAVGLTIGLQKPILSAYGESFFNVESLFVVGTFLVTFGIVKGLMNFYGGGLSETYGRKKLLVASWLVALPIPVILAVAPNWWWVVFSTGLLGINQGFAFSMTVYSVIDLAGPKARALAVGLDETVGYLGVAFGAQFTGFLVGSTQTLSSRPMTAFGVLGAVIVLGLLTAVFLVKDTRKYGLSAQGGPDPGNDEDGDLSTLEVFKRTTFGSPTRFAAVQAGHVEKYIDALVFLLFPVYFVTSQGGFLTFAELGTVELAYGATFGVVQAFAGGFADRVGRRPLIVGGMLLAGAATIGIVEVTGFVPVLALATGMGLGLALLYPNLQAVIGDVSHPEWRATGVGAYRLWRDFGYAVGAAFVGLLWDLAGPRTAFYVVGGLVVASGAVALWLLRETHPELRGRDVAEPSSPDEGLPD
jgi:MFS family permease